MLRQWSRRSFGRDTAWGHDYVTSYWRWFFQGGLGFGSGSDHTSGQGLKRVRFVCRSMKTKVLVGSEFKERLKAKDKGGGRGDDSLPHFDCPDDTPGWVLLSTVRDTVWGEG